MEQKQLFFAETLENFFQSDFNENLNILYKNKKLNSIKFGTSGFRLHGKLMPYITWRTSIFLGILSQSRPNEVFGMVITASHNPAKDNGIKILINNSHMLGKDFESNLEVFAHEICLHKAVLNLLKSSFYKEFSIKNQNVKYFINYNQKILIKRILK